jgi:FkbH-like protein
MKLIEALRIAGSPAPESGAPLNVLLATGFSPLHLQTFLAAHLRMAFPNHRVNVESGLYGDLAGTLERLGEKLLDAVIVAIEWTDLDRRLGIRSLGGWSPQDLPNIVDTVRANARCIEDAVRNRKGTVPVAVCLPTLPLPPTAFTPGWQACTFDLELRECVSELASRLGQCKGTSIVNPQRVDRLSPTGTRFSVKSELQYGFPYALAHADVIAEQLTLLVQSRPPKKGLITDLDDTLWSGIVGEVGARGVFWDLDHDSQMHGVYQQMLRSLAESGVLIAAASKNNPDVVAEVFRREDLLLPEKHLFPVEVHWGAKSNSVARILEAWNIGADSVVYVDDSPMELGEVRNAFPELECIQFPTGNDHAIYELLETLRDRFGKPRISEEDRVRLESIRGWQSVREKLNTVYGDSSRFLENIDGQISLEFTKVACDPRALQLVNKTNQFNLNGNRYTEAAWLSYLQQPDTFLLVVSYQDRYGRLGKIAVITGRATANDVFVDNWVMSCRAFARQIEHCCLEHLFERYRQKEIVFNFVATARNTPLQDFFKSFLGEAPKESFRLGRQVFVDKCPQLLHSITESEPSPSPVA